MQIFKNIYWHSIVISILGYKIDYLYTLILYKINNEIKNCLPTQL